MDISFPLSQIKVFEAEISALRNSGEFEEQIGNQLRFRFVQPSRYSVERVIDRSAEGMIFEGYPVYLRMSANNYNTADVTAGVREATREEENPTPPPDTITVNQLFAEWQPLISREKNDNLQVIIGVPYVPTIEEIELFDEDPNVSEVMGIDVILGQYDNDIDWVLDENGLPVVEPPVEKTAEYWIENWDTDGEAFDFLHAQRITRQWFNTLGANDTDRFNTLDGPGKRAVIQMGILFDNTEGKGLIEATITNPRNREFYKRWHTTRLIAAREKRFNDAWAYLIDSFKNNAVITRMEVMLETQLRQFYIYRGSSNQPQHLIVSGTINSDFWIQFAESDVAYTDLTLADLQFRVEKILDANRY